MKHVLTFILLCVLHISIFAQTNNDSQPIKSKIETLLAENGTLLEATHEEIGAVGYSLSIQVIRIKNLSTGAKNAGLLFETRGNRAIIDADEMDLLSKSLTIMKDAANGTRPVETDIRYKSRTGFEIHASFEFERTDALNNTKTGERKWMYML